jgi:glycosyltransferase 2 family protein
VALFIIARNRKPVEGWINRIGAGNETVKKHVLPQVDSFFLGLSALRNPLQFISALLLMISSWGIAIVESYVLLLQFAPQAQLWWCALALGIIALGIAIPSAPAALGVWEGSTVLALSLFKIDPTSAVAYAISVHLMNIIINGAFGLYGLANSGKSISSLMHDLGLRQPPDETTMEQSHV